MAPSNLNKSLEPALSALLQKMPQLHKATQTAKEETISGHSASVVFQPPRTHKINLKIRCKCMTLSRHQNKSGWFLTLKQTQFPLEPVGYVKKFSSQIEL